MLACNLIHPADPMETRHGEHHERTGPGHDAMGHLKIRLIGGMPLPLSIDDQLSAPIRLPLVMKITHHCETAPRRRDPLHRIALVRIVMGQQAIALRIGVVTEPDMASTISGKDSM